MIKSERRGVNYEEMILNGSESAYEALQLYRSKIIRLKNKNNLFESLTLCSIGIINFLKYNYYSEGNELEKLFLDILKESKSELSLDIRNLINNINQAYQANSIQHGIFLKECIKYSILIGSRVYGDPLLHKQLGEYLWKSGQEILSIKHFILGESPELFWQYVRILSFSFLGVLLKSLLIVNYFILLFVCCLNVLDSRII